MQQDSLINQVFQFLDDLRRAAQMQLQLLDLEAQQAGTALALMMVYGLVAGLLLCVAWIGLCAAGVLWLVQLGCNLSLALLLGVLLNLVGGLGLGLAMRRKARALSFPATRQSLGIGVLLFLIWRKLRLNKDA